MDSVDVGSIPTACPIPKKPRSFAPWVLGAVVSEAIAQILARGLKKNLRRETRAMK